MSFADLPLIPSDETELDPDTDVALAEESLLAAADGRAAQAPALTPFGRTPMFDFDRGRFARAGDAVVWVSGLEAVAQWCLMAVHSARYAHRGVFTADFGMEEPDAVIGQAADVEEALSDWGARLSDALLVHDRIVAVEEFTAEWDPLRGVALARFSVVTDAGDFAIEDLEITVRNEGEDG